MKCTGCGRKASHMSTLCGLCILEVSRLLRVAPSKIEASMRPVKTTGART